MDWEMLSKMPEGTRVRFDYDFDVYPIGIVPEGTEGVITDINPEIVCILPDSEDLRVKFAEWDGCVHVYAWDETCPVDLAEVIQ